MSFLLNCPNCGNRNVNEFRFGGEVTSRPAPDASQEQWASYSSGKTRLAEALEWLLTGSPSRRERRHSGNPRELEKCMSNQFCPGDVDTWVSTTFILKSQGDFEEIVLRRVLKKDYGVGYQRQLDTFGPEGSG